MLSGLDALPLRKDFAKMVRRAFERALAPWTALQPLNAGVASSALTVTHAGGTVDFRSGTPAAVRWSRSPSGRCR
jgi:hypothetical protein